MELLVVGLYLYYWLSLQALGLILFRFKPWSYRRFICGCTVVLTLTSILLQSFNIFYLTSIIQPLALFLCYCSFYRFRPIHSLLITIMTFGLNVFLENIFNLLMANLNHTDFIQISRDDYIFQGIFFTLINNSIAFLLYKYRIGFSFLSSNKRNIEHSRLSKNMKYLLIVGCLFTGSTSYAIFYFEKFVLVSISLILLAILSLLFYSFVKEMKD